MEYKYFIGIDVSKNTLDISLLVSELGSAKHLQVSNSDNGILTMLKWLQELENYSVKESLFCLEHTGMYNYPLLQFFSKQSANVWVENPIQIKKSLGLQRGKNDKVDALRIAQYAQRAKDRVKLWHPSREVVDKLRHLSALRERLVQTKLKLYTPVDELKKVGNTPMAKVLEKSMSKTMKGLEKDLKAIEAQMKDVIDRDDNLRNLYALVTSVIGIGFVTAVNMIVYTNEFKLFSNHRQFACYSGIAPFEYRSGTSIRGRTRVSHMANKKMKRQLHMASLTGIKFDEALKQYYERKVSSGKNKMSVLNAVRNKLVARVFAVVNRGIPYKKTNYQNQLVLS
ncbi:MAG TPA: IS110 family transposase [Cyclobacteriaceae bacterium]|jgi:transposase